MGLGFVAAGLSAGMQGAKQGLGDITNTRGQDRAAGLFVRQGCQGPRMRRKGGTTSRLRSAHGVMGYWSLGFTLVLRLLLA